jgi:hypothetical protein
MNGRDGVLPNLLRQKQDINIIPSRNTGAQLFTISVHPCDYTVLRAHFLEYYRGRGQNCIWTYSLKFSTGNGGRSLKNPESNIKLILLFTR